MRLTDRLRAVRAVRRGFFIVVVFLVAFLAVVLVETFAFEFYSRLS